MKLTSCFFVLLLTALLSLTAAEPKSNFYSDYSDALLIPGDTARTDKLIKLLMAHPEKAEELFLTLKDELRTIRIVPYITEQFEKILTANPADPFIVTLAIDAGAKNKAKIRKEFLTRCDRSALTPAAWDMFAKIFNDFIFSLVRKTSALEHSELIFKISSTLPENLSPQTRFTILESALYHFWYAAWQEYLCAPNFARWRTLPDAGNKKFYDDTLNQLIALEKRLPFPASHNLLLLYNKHDHPRAGIYAENFIGTANQSLREQMYQAAVMTKNRKLFAQFPQIEKGSLPGAYILAIVFKDYAALEKHFPKNEALLIKYVSEKNFTAAEKTAAELIASGKISSWFTVRAVIDLIWHNKNKEMLKKVVAIAEKNPKVLMNNNVANGAGYTFAVLNIELDHAEKLLKSVVASEPGVHSYLDSMAYIYYRKRDFRQARRYIRLALRRAVPSDSQSTILLHAAEIEFAATGNKAAAKKYLKQAELAAKSDDTEYDYARAAELKKELAK